MADERDAVEITPLENGPLRCRGILEIHGPAGRDLDHKDPTFLCRCGGSGNKPFCDGTHKRIHFEAPGARS